MQTPEKIAPCKPLCAIFPGGAAFFPFDTLKRNVRPLWVKLTGQLASLRRQTPRWGRIAEDEKKQDKALTSVSMPGQITFVHNVCNCRGFRRPETESNPERKSAFGVCLPTIPDGYMVYGGVIKLHAILRIRTTMDENVVRIR